MKKKIQLNEVRQLQKIAGILKEDRVQDALDDIVDIASSGQGEATGLALPTFQDQVKSLVGSLSPEEKQQLSAALNNMIETVEGWTDSDVEFLNSIGLNITAQPISYGDDSERDKIENWYWNTNFYIDNLSPQEVKDGIQAHYDEWMAVKDQYDNIQDYFNDVERNGDWY